MKKISLTITMCLVVLLAAGVAVADQSKSDGDNHHTQELPSGDLAIFCSTPNLDIPDDDPAGVTDVLVVPGSMTITDLNVSINASHTWVGDLTVFLRNDDTGTEVPLINRAGLFPNDPDGCCGCSGDNVDCEIDDEGVDGSVEDQCGDLPALFGSPTGGDPQDGDVNVLSNFDGEDLGGSWSLRISDDAGGDLGTLHEWCLIAEDVPPCRLQVRTDRRVVRAGEPLRVALDITHHKVRSATVPVFVWIEDQDGNVVTHRQTRPMTLEFGQHVRRTVRLNLPADTPSGVYTLRASVREMQQGVATARQTLRVE